MDKPRHHTIAVHRGSEVFWCEEKFLLRIGLDEFRVTTRKGENSAGNQVRGNWQDKIVFANTSDAPLALQFGEGIAKVAALPGFDTKCFRNTDLFQRLVIRSGEQLENFIE